MLSFDPEYPVSLTASNWNFNIRFLKAWCQQAPGYSGPAGGMYGKRIRFAWVPGSSAKTMG